MERTNSLNGAVAIEMVAALTEIGMTRLQLSEKTGIHKNSISRLLRNQTQIDLDVLVLVSNAIGIEPRELIERAEYRLSKAVN
jgi:transcriptional regulator with XRE-family HTH domain